MSRRTKLYDLVMKSDSNNIPFKEIQKFLKVSGFILKRSIGSHNLYEYSKYSDIFINIQPKNGLVKGYQLKQIRNSIRKIESDEMEEQ